MTSAVPDSTRTRVLEGALACIRRSGSTRLTFTEVAAAAGLARQTVHAHFADREDLLHATVAHAAVRLTAEVARAVEPIEDVGDALVEVVVAFHEAARSDVALAQVIAMTLHPRVAEHGTLSAEAMRLTRGFLRPRLAGTPDADRLDEVAEVLLRFLLSVLGYASASTETPDRLRAFLHRSLVPALGLAPPSRDTSPDTQEHP